MAEAGACSLWRREELVVYGGGRSLFVGGIAEVTEQGITRVRHCE